MSILTVTQIQGVNTYLNPLNAEGQLLHGVNVDSYPFGAKTKRPGYITYLGTADGSAVNTLFNWTKNDGTTFFNYRASGSSLYYSAQGTGAWTLCGNGTISPGSRVGYAVHDNTLIVGDGVGSTRHTTNGTSFTNTTLAPVSPFFEQYQGRAYLSGTSSTVFYSTTNDITNWSTSGTSDSSSFTAPGAGKNLKLFKVSDMLCITKNSGLAYRWDGYNLVDTSTNMAPSSPYSVADAEGYKFILNRIGIYGYGGGQWQLLSNPIQRQIFNNAGSGIPGSQFDIAPGETYKYNYYLGVGTITDDLVGETIPNAVIKYDYQKNEYTNYSLSHNPTSFLRYKDTSGNEQLLFGSSNGQVYQFSGTTRSDAGLTIPSAMMYVSTHGKPEWQKEYKWFYGYFNPGCQAHISIAWSDTYTTSRLRWIELGQAVDGIVTYRFPQGSRGRILFIKIMESSVDTPFTFYGFSVDAEPIKQ